MEFDAGIFSLIRFEISVFLFFRFLCFLVTGVDMSLVDRLLASVGITLFSSASIDDLQLGKKKQRK